MNQITLKIGQKIRIRKYEHPRDFESISEINRLSLRVQFDYLFESFSRKYPELFLIAEDAEKFKKLGFVLGQIGGVKGEKNASLIYAIAVHPDYRRRGIGALLIDELARALRTHHEKIKRIFLHVQESNEGAIKFYMRYGFKEKKFMKKFYSWGEGAYRLYYEL
ncbi:MAG: GNAT family N-acetyltransferase [Candidatus Helarchaeales archaeon]